MSPYILKLIDIPHDDVPLSMLVESLKLFIWKLIVIV